MDVWLLVRWTLVLAVLTCIGAPLATLVFSRLPRKGAAFSLPVTILCWTTVVFLLGQIAFGYPTLIIGLLVVVLLSGLAYYRGSRPEWRAVGVSYGIFLIGFLLYAIYASYNAAITPLGGEQFLHYGLTNTLVHAESFPPEDFWFAGKDLRYYYGTQLQVAMLSMVTGTELRFGFYLGLATFYGMLFVSGYGLAGSVVNAQDRSYHLGGIFGVCFVALGGTLVTTLRLVFGRLPQSRASDVARPVYHGLVKERGMSFADAYRQGSVSEWFWFYDRYVIEGALNEFPLYSLVKADLHGHSLSTVYIVVAGAMAFSYYQTPAEQRVRRLGILYGALGLVAGVFGFMNTWALPSAVGLAWLAIAAADAHPATLLGSSIGDVLTIDRDNPSPLVGFGQELWRVVLAAVLAVPVGIVGVIIASPFLFNSVPTNDGIGLFPPQTPLISFFIMYGGLLAVLVTYLAVSARSGDTLGRAHVVGEHVLLAISFTLGVLGMPSAALLVPLLAVAWWVVRTDRGDFSIVLLIAGFGLLLSMEIVHAVVYPFERVRWNTTLKVAVQGWTLAAAGAGAASALLLSRAGEQLSTVRNAEMTTDWKSTTTAAVPALLTAVLVIAVTLSGLSFAGLVAYHEVGDDILSPSEGSVDALETHDTYKSNEMEALYWLQDNTDQATIAEAPARDAYQWKSVASVFTDAVTVAGWNHQEGYRGEEAYDNRATQVELLYIGSQTDVRETIQRYDVEYIYVGPSERESFQTINNFRAMDGIDVAFSNTEVTIYEVRGDFADE
jgi:YYY domain-containing protein